MESFIIFEDRLNNFWVIKSIEYFGHFLSSVFLSVDKWD